MPGFDLGSFFKRPTGFLVELPPPPPFADPQGTGVQLLPLIISTALAAVGFFSTGTY